MSSEDILLNVAETFDSWYPNCPCMGTPSFPEPYAYPLLLMKIPARSESFSHAEAIMA